MSERLKDFEEAIDQMIHNYQSMVDSENRSKTELYAKNYVDYREFIVEAYKKALSRVEELEDKCNYLSDMNEMLVDLNGVLPDEPELYIKLKKENKRYREALNSIMTLWKYSEDRTDFEWLAHKMSEEARKELEGEE